MAAARAMRFSGAVVIDNENDFLAPSQACVVSLNGKRLDRDDADGSADAGEVRIPLHVFGSLLRVAAATPA